MIETGLIMIYYSRGGYWGRGWVNYWAIIGSEINTMAKAVDTSDIDANRSERIIFIAVWG